MKGEKPARRDAICDCVHWNDFNEAAVCLQIFIEREFSIADLPPSIHNPPFFLL
jgi:hypothetical protein